MLIVDSQVHIWGANTHVRPWPKRHPPHRSAFSAEELIVEMDTAEVDAAVLVPPSWEGEYNDLITQAVMNHPHRFAAMAVSTPDAAPELIARWPFPRGVRGMRCPVHRPGLIEALDDGRMDRVWAAAEQHGVVLMVLIPNERIAKIDEVAQRHPGLRLIVDHLGLTFTSGDRRAALQKVLPLARHANVGVKASNLPAYAPDEAYPYPGAQALLRDAIGAFGAQRVFWGTDLTGMPCSYREGVNVVTAHMPDLSAADREWVMGRALCEWLDWFPHQPSA